MAKSRRGRPKGSFGEQAYLTRLAKYNPREFKRFMIPKMRGRRASPIESLKVLGGNLRVKTSKSRIRVGRMTVEV